MKLQLILLINSSLQHPLRLDMCEIPPFSFQIEFQIVEKLVYHLKYSNVMIWWDIKKPKNNQSADYSISNFLTITSVTHTLCDKELISHKKKSGYFSENNFCGFIFRLDYPFLIFSLRDNEILF